MRRDKFYYTNGDKRGLVVLLVLIVVLSVVFFVVRSCYDPADEINDDGLSEYMAFRQSLAERDSIERKSYERYRNNVRKKPYRYVLSEVKPSFFDPNADDSAALADAGLPPYVARNIVRYRMKGGKFRKPEDLSRIYGMTDEIYAVMSPYIKISADYGHDSVGSDMPPVKYPRIEKYAEGTVIDLNLADTAQLKKIPGIGSGYAAMIVAYRERLGGYVSVGQLDEIENLPDGFEKWFVIGDGYDIRKMNINRFSLERLRSHPYMNFYRAKAIVEYRRKYGRIENINRLGMLDEFQDGVLEKLKPYIEL